MQAAEEALKTGGKDVASCVHQFRDHGVAALVFLETEIGPKAKTAGR